MFIKLTKNSVGKTYVRIMESVRKGDQVLQKTLMSIGSGNDEQEVEILKQAAHQILVKMSNEREACLPGMAEIVYSKEPGYCIKRPTKSRKKKALSLFRLSNPREKARVHYGIKGVCGAVYEQLNFHTIIQGNKKDRQWNEILKSCVLSRIAQPDSKRKTVETLSEDYMEMRGLNFSIQKMREILKRDPLSFSLKQWFYSEFVLRASEV